MLYKSLVRDRTKLALESLSKNKALEKVQLRATRLVTALRDKPYQERLRSLDFPT